MKVGSLCICPNGANNKACIPGVITLPASEEIIYTVREIWQDEGTNYKLVTGILLKEVRNGLAYGGQEWGYAINQFREVQPPMDLSELMKETELLTLVNV